MKRSKKIIQVALGFVFLAPFFAFLAFLNLRPDIAMEPLNAATPGAPVVENASASTGLEGDRLRVTWLGAGTVLITDGRHTLITDGFFSRPSLIHTFFGKLAPDPERIEKALALAGIRELDAVVPLHSHHDHMLDSSWLSERFDALLLGSPSVANVARGAGLPEALIREVAAGSRVSIGDFTLTFHPSSHVPMPPLLERLMGSGETIRHPVSMPAPLSDWVEGEIMSLVVTHPEGRVLVHSSAGFRAGALDAQDVDLALVSAGLLGKQSQRYQRRYFKAVIAASSPETVVPIHWDNPFEPLSRHTGAMPLLMDNVQSSLDAVRQHCEDAGINMKVLPPLSGLELHSGRVQFGGPDAMQTPAEQ